MDNTELSFIDFNYTLFFLTIQSAIFLSFRTFTHTFLLSQALL